MYATRKRNLSRLVATLAACIGGVLALFVCVMEVIDDHPKSSWLYRQLFLPSPHYFTFAVDLVVDEELMTLTRTIECRPYRYSMPGVDWFGLAWYPATEAITHRLESGAGIVVVVPNACRATVLPANYIPLILRVDNVDMPSLMEAYFSGALVTSTASRVRFLRFRFEQRSRPEPALATDEFGVWDNLTQSGYRHRTGRKNFAGLIARAIPESDWRAAGIDLTNATAGPLSGLAKQKTQEAYWKVVGDWGEATEGTTTGTHVIGDGHSAPDRFQDVVPLKLVNGALQPSPEDRGKFLYYPASKVIENYEIRTSVPPELDLVTIRVSDTSLKIPLKLPTPIYDPNTKTIYQTTITLIRFVLSPSDEGI